LYPFNCRLYAAVKPDGPAPITHTGGFVHPEYGHDHADTLDKKLNSTIHQRKLLIMARARDAIDAGEGADVWEGE